ncbi:hypothetical protein [Kineococcus sp. SYSU DK018]|uniref:hypothetical protein n=1 Tax=Kineococcus sp. SYSU DK018 TaxID=3383139 RepID=UPI003D7CCC79
MTDDPVHAVRAAVERTLDAAVLAFESTFEVLGPPFFRSASTGCCDLRVPVVRGEVSFDPGRVPWPSATRSAVLHERTLWLGSPGDVPGGPPQWEALPVRGLAACDLVTLLWVRGVTAARERPGEPGRFDVRADAAAAAAHSPPDVAASLREDPVSEPPVDVLRGSVLIGDGGAGIVRKVDLTVVGDPERRVTLALRRTARCTVEVPVTGAG